MSNPALPIRFGQTHKRMLYTSFGLLWGSGLLWLLFHYFIHSAGAFGDTAHPLEMWWLSLHGLMALAAMLAIGSVLPVHAQRAWQLNKNRNSGLIIKLYLLWLAGTGYALYYFTSEANEVWLPWSHWLAGIVVPLVLGMHIVLGRKRQSSRQSSVQRHPLQNPGLHHKQRR